MADREVKVRFVGDDKQLSATTKKVERDVSTLGDKLGSVLGPQLGAKVDAGLGKIGVNASSSALQLAAVAGPAIAGFVASSVTKFQHLGTEVLKFSRVSGAAAEESSRWIQVADDYNVSADDAAASMGRLAKVISTTPGKLKELGVGVARNRDGTVDLTGTMVNLADAYARTTDQTKRAELGSAAFGKQWQTLVPLLEKGGDGLRSALEGVSDAQILDDEDVKKAERFRLAMDAIGDSLQKIQITVGGAVIDKFSSSLERASKAADLANAGLSKLGTSLGEVVDMAISPVGMVEAGWNRIFGSKPQKQVWEMADSVDNFHAGQKQLLESLDEYTYHAETAEERTKRLAKETDALTKSEDAYRRSVQESSQAKLDSMGIGLDLYRSEQDLGVAVDEYNAKAKEKTKNTKEAAEKAADLADKQRDLEDRIMGTAKAAATNAKNQAEMAGKTFTAADEANAMIGELESLKKKFPELTPFIDAYIAKLREIPGTINTDLSISNKGVPTGGNSVRRASGGSVPGHLGEPVMVMAHAGEEFGTPGQRGGGGGGGGDMREVVSLLRYIATHSRWTAVDGNVASERALVGYR